MNLLPCGCMCEYVVDVVVFAEVVTVNSKHTAEVHIIYLIASLAFVVLAAALNN